MDNFRPTAERQPAALLGELKSKARHLFATICRDEEINLERAVELGRTLQVIRDRCEDGIWGRTLEEIAISRQRASEYRRIAKLSKGEISMCGSIRGALEYLNTLEPNNPPADGSLSSAGQSTLGGCENPPAADPGILGKHSTTPRDPVEDYDTMEDYLNRPSGDLHIKGRVAEAFTSVFQEIEAIAAKKNAQDSPVIRDLRDRAVQLQKDFATAYRTL